MRYPTDEAMRRASRIYSFLIFTGYPLSLNDDSMRLLRACLLIHTNSPKTTTITGSPAILNALARTLNPSSVTVRG